METELFEKILSVESTSGTEKEFAEYIEKLVPALSSGIGAGKACSARRFEVGDGTVNLLFSWGTSGDEMPEVCLCTHLDTVPPYFPPHSEILPQVRSCRTEMLQLMTTC